MNHSTASAAPRTARSTVPAACEPTRSREWRIFWSLRRRILGAIVRQALRSARLKVAVATVFSIAFWIGLFWLFIEGFTLLNSGLASEGVRAQTVQAIYNIFFLALTCMIAVSSAIILYGALYRSQEAAFLLTTPARASSIVRHKLDEATLFSCWGFILLGSPMLIAYGVANHAPWPYFALLAPFMAGFVLIPTGLGGVACLLIVRFFPKRRLHALALACLAAAAALAAMGWSVFGGRSHDLMTPAWFQDVIGRLQFTEQRLLPSWWLSSGLLEAAHPAPHGEGRPAWLESALFLAVLWSNALVLQRLAMWAAERCYRQGYSGLYDLSRARRRAQAGWLDRLVERLLFWLSPVMRSLIIKDLRLFRRDLVQWSQFAIFFGLLSLYFLNIRRFQYAETLVQWVTVIGFLNLGVVGLILSTYTTRFILPAISLEGRRFWILGTLPISRDAILWSKLIFACVGSIPVCCGLILLSDAALGITARTPLIAAVHQAVCLILCIGLSSLAVGVGARLPQLRETSPSKIAAGFGGTLNLVLSATLIIGTVVATAIPSYWWVAGGASQSSWLARTLALGSWPSVAAGLCLAFAFGLAATIIPLRLGFRAFRRLEV